MRLLLFGLSLPLLFLVLFISLIIKIAEPTTDINLNINDKYHKKNHFLKVMKLWEYISDYKFKVFNTHWWRDFHYRQISARFRPRNKWLTKQIPRTWIDKDTLLEIVVLGSLKHYCEVDGEDCFNTLSCTSPEWQAEFMREVKYNYEMVTQRLVVLQKELEAEWAAVPCSNWKKINNGDWQSYDVIYGNIDRLEKEIYDVQTEIMVWVVKNRNGLWT